MKISPKIVKNENFQKTFFFCSFYATLSLNAKKYVYVERSGMIQRQRRKKRKKPLKSETQTHTQTEEANTEDTIMPSVIFFFSLMKPRSRKEKNPEWSPFQIITKLDVACHY